MPNESNRAVFLLLKLIFDKFEHFSKQMERRMSELSDAVAGVTKALGDLDPKIDTIVTGVAALETALGAAGQVPPDVAQAVTDLKAAATDLTNQSAKVAVAISTLPTAPAPSPTGATGPTG